MSDEIETIPAAGPWADDLRTALGDDHGTAFEAVDGYLRERWQPRVTELEEGTKDARELWKDLTDDAPTALYGLVNSVYGEEFATKYIELFGNGEETTTPAEETVETPPAADAPDGLNDEERAWLRGRREAEQAKERDDAYTATKRELLEQHKDVLTEDDLEILDPFIAAAPDLDTAIAMYQDYQAKLRQRLGVAEEAPVVPTPPPVLGSEGAPAATPPAKTEYTKWGDLFKDGGAVDAYFDRQAATATPPPVIG